MGCCIYDGQECTRGCGDGACLKFFDPRPRNDLPPPNFGHRLEIRNGPDRSRMGTWIAGLVLGAGRSLRRHVPHPGRCPRVQMKTTITKAHVRIYRAVEGAVRNTAHGHPDWPLNAEIACSIAKRATGTLTAGWPDVLAAGNEPSERDGGRGESWPPSSRRAAWTRRKGRASVQPRRSPASLRSLWNEISSLVGPAKRAGDDRAVEVLVDVLRRIDARARR